MSQEPETCEKELERLRRRIADLEDEKVRYERQIRELEEMGAHCDTQMCHMKVDIRGMDDQPREDQDLQDTSATQLSSDQIQRYSRQLLLADGFGVTGQCKLLSSSVLVVGAGGIGSTVLLYLAASGVGHISVVDFDDVDMSNLHRQVIHRDRDTGVNKAVSACRAMRELNPTIRCTPIEHQLTHENALDVISAHDCVVDASDNPRTRYLVNDACVMAGKPLVSGSAIGTEGQLTIYNYAGGPCYRCLYPKPNSAEGCNSCSDHGVLGPVPGMIGILQAVEVVKVLTGVGSTMQNRLMMYDSLQCSFMNVKKPSKVPDCSVCGVSPSILSMNDSRALSDVTRGPSSVVENGRRASFMVKPTNSNGLSISCADYQRIRQERKPHVLLDVRVERQYEMCSLDGALNIPLARLADELNRVADASAGTLPVYCICRRGIFSPEAARMLNEAACTNAQIHSVKNISGGLASWSTDVDPSFPKY